MVREGGGVATRSRGRSLVLSLWSQWPSAAMRRTARSRDHWNPLVDAVACLPAPYPENPLELYTYLSCICRYDIDCICKTADTNYKRAYFMWQIFGKFGRESIHCDIDMTKRSWINDLVFASHFLCTILITYWIHWSCLQASWFKPRLRCLWPHKVLWRLRSSSALVTLKLMWMRCLMSTCLKKNMQVQFPRRDASEIRNLACIGFRNLTAEVLYNMLIYVVYILQERHVGNHGSTELTC